MRKFTNATAGAAFVVLLVIVSAVRAEDEKQCLSVEAARSREKSEIFLCALLKSANNKNSANELPQLACSHSSNSACKMLSTDYTHCCFLETSTRPSGAKVLNVVPEFVNNAGYSSGKVKLHKSVSSFVAASEFLAIKGAAVAAIDPEVFYDVGDSQKIKDLVISETSLESFDIGVLRALTKLENVAFFLNKKLTKITNYGNEKLTNIKSIIFANNNQSILNCKNFKSLPQSINEIWIFDSETDLRTVLSNSCVMCSLPKTVTKVNLAQNFEKVPYFPNANGSPGARPFPFIKMKVMQSVGSYPLHGYKAFTIDAAAATGCDKCSSSSSGGGDDCEVWTTTAAPATAAPPRQIEESEKAVEAGSSMSGTSGGGGAGGGGNAAGTLVASFAAAAAAAVLAVALRDDAIVL